MKLSTDDPESTGASFEVTVNVAEGSGRTVKDWLVFPLTTVLVVATTATVRLPAACGVMVTRGPSTASGLTVPSGATVAHWKRLLSREARATRVTGSPTKTVAGALVKRTTELNGVDFGSTVTMIADAEVTTPSAVAETLTLYTPGAEKPVAREAAESCPSIETVKLQAFTTAHARCPSKQQLHCNADVLTMPDAVATKLTKVPTLVVRLPPLPRMVTLVG